MNEILKHDILKEEFRSPSFWGILSSTGVAQNCMNETLKVKTQGGVSYSVLRTITPVMNETLKVKTRAEVSYSVLRTITPVLQSITPYYEVLPRTTKYFSVLQSSTKYFSVLQSTTPVLLCTTKDYVVLQSDKVVFPTYCLLATPKYVFGTATLLPIALVFLMEQKPWKLNAFTYCFGLFHRDQKND